MANRQRDDPIALLGAIGAALLAPEEPSRLFRRGESVSVYYSASRPSVSALRRGLSPFVWITLSAGVLVVWTGIWLLGS